MMGAAKKSFPKPFGYKRAPCIPAPSETQQECVCCGRGVEINAKTVWAHVVDGGATYGGEKETDDPGDMGWFPVGIVCVKRLRKAGVYVQTLDNDAPRKEPLS